MVIMAPSAEEPQRMDEGFTSRRQRPPYLWDHNITFEEFQGILNGTFEFGRLNRDWAAVRLIEYASYDEMIRLLGYKAIVEGWPRWRAEVRMVEVRRGLDFLVEWLSQRHPELLNDNRSTN